MSLLLPYGTVTDERRVVIRKVRITGTINDEWEVDGLTGGETDEEIINRALDDWRYTEYEDLEGEIEE
jgi:hypothetical protein